MDIFREPLANITSFKMCHMSQRIHTEAGTVLKDISSTSSKNLRNLTKYIFKKICLFTPIAIEIKLIAFKFPFIHTVSLQAV